MAMEEAKLMGLELLPDPERSSNAPRDHTFRDGARAKYLYDNNDPEDWGSTASESDSDDGGAGGQQEQHAYDSQETGGLTDREIDRLDGKASSRLGRSTQPAISQDGKGAAAGRAPGYPERDTGANTGPKGVIADQKYHQQQQLQERASSQQAYNARMLSKAPMTTTYQQDVEREQKEKKALGLLDKDDDEDTLAEADGDEKAILDRIRGNRLREMAWSSRAEKTGGGLGGKKVFGSLMEMNSAQYVNAIDTEKKDVTIVIHIYSEYDPACKKLDGCLIRLAGRYATTKFVRIKALEVEFDEEVCPTLLAYRAGDLIANLVMISYELSEDYDDAELEELLTKHKVLSPHDQYQRTNAYFDLPSGSSSHVAELNMMSLGLGVGDGARAPPISGLSGGGSGRRGILSGNVKEFHYQDYDDEDAH
ncbi:hypothetical protein BGZ98_009891 [Dissophora globulifera]|nr:hypothetical protein BGZ98_009891 [Dissophora globulifera]